MKFLIVFAAFMAVASAQFLSDFGTVVKGPKTIIAGPSGTIAADTGAVIRTPDSRTIIAAPTTRLIGSPLIDSGLYGRNIVGSPLIDSGLYGRSIIGSPLLERSLVAPFPLTRGLYSGFSHDLFY